MADSYVYLYDTEDGVPLKVKAVDLGGGLYALASSATLTGDVELGAVEIKDGTSDNRAAVDSSGRLTVNSGGVRAPTTPVLYRSAVVAADTLSVPGTVTCTKIAGGAATAGTYNVKVVAGNGYGRTTATAGNTTITTETTNLTVRAAFAQVTGATFYDIYCSTDSDPKFVGRISEAQRATGIVLATVNTPTAGGTAGAVDVQTPGTGLQAATTAAVNTAYVIPASPVDCSGYQYVDFDLSASRTGDSVALALTVAPFFLDANDSLYYQGAAVVLAFGGTTAALNSNRQRLRVECRGSASVALLVQTIAGTGAAVDMRVGGKS